MSTQPEHYAGFKIQPMDAVDDWDLNFGLGSVIELIANHKRDGTPLEDLEQARFLIDREIQKLKDAKAKVEAIQWRQPSMSNPKNWTTPNWMGVVPWKCVHCGYKFDSTTRPTRCSSCGHNESIRPEPATPAPKEPPPKEDARKLYTCHDCKWSAWKFKHPQCCGACGSQKMIEAIVNTKSSTPKLMVCHHCDVDQFGHEGDTCLKCGRPSLSESTRPKEWKGQSMIWVCEKCNWIAPLSTLSGPTKCPDCKGEKFIHPEFDPETPRWSCDNCGRKLTSTVQPKDCNCTAMGGRFERLKEP